MNAPSILAHIADVNDAARDYRIVMADAQCPEDIHDGLGMLGFEIAKRVLDVPRAAKLGPVLVKGAKVSLCLVVEQREVEVVVCAMTGRVSVISDDRVRGAA